MKFRTRSYYRRSRIKHSAFLAWILVLPLASFGDDAAPDTIPPAIRTIGSWRDHDPEHPRPGFDPWTPKQVVELLATHPSLVLDLGIRNSMPPGITHWKYKGKKVNEAQSIAKSKGIDLSNRLCLPFRFDMYRKYQPGWKTCDIHRGGGGCDWEGDMDGRFGESETVVKVSSHASGGGANTLRDDDAKWRAGAWRHRVLVLRPNEKAEEARRIIGNDLSTLTVAQSWSTPPSVGDRYEIRGSFDPAWIRRVPVRVHEASVERFWTKMRNVCGRDHMSSCRDASEPLDPLESGNSRGWQPRLDREAIERLASPSSVPALYGLVRDGDDRPKFWADPHFVVSGLVMDTANADYRDWRIRYLLYKLQDHGLDPGEPACVKVTYKPGWHTFYDEHELGSSSDPCATENSNMWTGPAHVCDDGKAPGGPFNPTPFRPGEFESSVNAFLRSIITILTDYGYKDIAIVTVERPDYRNRRWFILEPTIQSDPKLIGEFGGSIESLAAKPNHPSRAPKAPGIVPRGR